MSTTPAGSPDPVTPGHVDVLIVGAGLSGIGAACHLQAEAPGTSYAIVEARGASGGTWDLFRFPGVRSDSDMFTLGYPFRPWKAARSIAGGRRDPALPPGDRGGLRRRPADQLPLPRGRRRLVQPATPAGP